MNNANEREYIKIRDLLIYMNIAVIISWAFKKISKRENIDVFSHAVSITMGWLVGKLITGYIESAMENTDEVENPPQV